MSNGSETSLWRWIRDDEDVRAVSRRELQLTRIENSAGSGMPDVEGIYRQSQIWIELKVSPRPKPGATVDVDHLRPKQIEWLHNRWIAGGNAWILIRVVKDCYMVPGNISRQVKAGMTEDELRRSSVIQPRATPLQIIRTAAAQPE